MTKVESKPLIIDCVSKQRELLFAYEKETQLNEFDEFDEWNTSKKIDQYLSKYRVVDCWRKA